MKEANSMKAWIAFFAFALVLGIAGAAHAESNPVAQGVETVTHAPFAGLDTVNDHLFTPVKEVNHAAIDATDKARGWVVSMGLNLGQPVE
jgi:hypothetical protein